MSFSFSVRAVTSAEALEQVKAKLDEVVASQPVHAADRAQALAVVEAYLGLVPIADSKDVAVSVSGYVGWNGMVGEADQVLTSANIGVSVTQV